MSVGTNSTALNKDSSLTRIWRSKSTDGSIDILAGIRVSTYRAVCTTTIDVMENVTAIDGNIRVTRDKTNSDVSAATIATAIDIAIDRTALTFCSNGTAINYDICVTIYTGLRTTAIDRLQNSSHMTFDIVTNRDVRITRSSCRRTKTTTKDILCDGTIDDVHSRIIGRAFCWCISSLVTTAINAVVNSTAIDIDRYCILWSTQYIVTAKYVVDSSVGRATLFHRHNDRTIDISSMVCMASA